LKIKARVFICKYVSGKIKLGEPEHIDYKWTNVKEAKEKIWLTTKDRKNLLEAAYKFYQKLPEYKKSKIFCQRNS